MYFKVDVLTEKDLSEREMSLLFGEDFDFMPLSAMVSCDVVYCLSCSA